MIVFVMLLVSGRVLLCSLPGHRHTPLEFSCHCGVGRVSLWFVVCVIGCGCVLDVVVVMLCVIHVSFLYARSLGVCWPSLEVCELRRMADIQCLSLGSLRFTALVSGWIHA